MLLNNIIYSKVKIFHLFLFVKGINQAKKDIVINMYNEGIDLNVISKCSNLSLAEINLIINQ